MGMDVYGKHPSCEDGKYYRASIWSWRVIHAIVGLANQRVPIITNELYDSMSYNDGAGLEDQTSCNELADCLEELIKDPYVLRKYEFVVGSDINGDILISFKVNKKFAIDSKNIFVKEGDKIPIDDLRSPYYISIGDINDFIKFLRSCGGFQVC